MRLILFGLVLLLVEQVVITQVLIALRLTVAMMEMEAVYLQGVSVSLLLKLR